MKKDLRYLQLESGDDLPVLAGIDSFLAIVVVETEFHQPWQWEVCRWLVSSGCRAVLAWGQECRSWEEAVDDAVQEAHDYEDIPEEQSVIITSHEEEDLADVFWYAKHRASHPAVDLNTTLILHIAPAPRRDELEAAYKEA
jgi:hypothetical protein